MTPIEKLKSVLCDPDGNVSITGTVADLAIIQDALDTLSRQPKVEVYDRNKRFRGIAPFHGFSKEAMEYDGSFAESAVAIIEWPDGQVEMVSPNYVRFIK